VLDTEATLNWFSILHYTGSTLQQKHLKVIANWVVLVFIRFNIHTVNPSQGLCANVSNKLQAANA